MTTEFDDLISGQPIKVVTRKGRVYNGLFGRWVRLPSGRYAMKLLTKDPMTRHDCEIAIFTKSIQDVEAVV